MNKLKLSALLILAALALGLASCATGRKPNTQNQGNTNADAENGSSSNAPSDDGYIFTETSDLTLVLPEGNLTEENFEKVFYAFSSLKMYNLTDGSKAPAKHEIVFGRCDREISTKAYRLLDQQDRNEPKYTGYVIYSDGNSLAIAYDEERYGLTIAQDVAIDCFVNEEGLLDHLPLNPWLTSFCEKSYGGPLVGDAIFVGHDSEGETVGLNEADAKAILNLFN